MAFFEITLTAFGNEISKSVKVIPRIGETVIVEDVIFVVKNVIHNYERSPIKIIIFLE